MSIIFQADRDRRSKIHHRKKLSKSVYQSKPVKKLIRPPKRRIPKPQTPTKSIKEKQLLLAPPRPPLGPRLPFRLSPAALLVPAIPTLVGEYENYRMVGIEGMQPTTQRFKRFWAISRNKYD